MSEKIKKETEYGFDVLNVAGGLYNQQIYKEIDFKEVTQITFYDVIDNIQRTETFPENFELKGKFKDITIVSGSAIGYLDNQRPLKFRVTKKGIIQYLGSTVGDTFVHNGKEYTVVDDTTIRNYDPLTDDFTSLCTTLVTDMSSLFYQKIDFNQSIGSWDTSNVTDMSFMFANTVENEYHQFDKYIGEWDVSKVTTFRGMFQLSRFNTDISRWDISSATTLKNMFTRTLRFNQPLNDWNTSSVTDISFMFSNAASFNQDLDKWDTSNMTLMLQTFGGEANDKKFNGDITTWDVSNVTDMRALLFDAKNFNRDLSKWCVSHIPSEPDFFSLQTSPFFTEDMKPNWGEPCVV